jgi:3-methyladenine DNA glycosylase/8-oxoguanine DNA glycosylase
MRVLGATDELLVDDVVVGKGAMALGILAGGPEAGTGSAGHGAPPGGARGGTTRGGGSRRVGAELRRHAERWRPWRSYAGMHLWRAASTDPATERAQARKKSA